MGSLLREPRSGYDLLKLLRHFRPAKASQIYPTLAKLQAAGFVTSSTVAQAGRPDKRIYSVTEAGIQKLSSWVGTDPDPAYNRDDFLTMVYSGWIKSPVELKDLFADRKIALQGGLDNLSSVLTNLERGFEKEMDNHSNWPFFAAMLVRRQIAILREDLSWTLNLMHRLEISVD